MKFTLKKVVIFATAVTAFGSSNLPAYADTFRHMGSLNWMNYNVVSNRFDTYQNASTSWTVIPDGSGYRLKSSVVANVCLNAFSSLSLGSTLFPYGCVAGDPGQVFTPTPNPGQLKFQAQGGTKCVAPFTNASNSLLRVVSCAPGTFQEFRQAP